MRRDQTYRPILAVSAIAGLTYLFSSRVHLDATYDLAWKGAGVGLLALYAAMRARDLNGWLLAGVMAFGALGDVLLGVSFIVGALAFLAGHLLAVWLYLRNRRAAITRSQGLLAVLLVPAVVLTAYLLPALRDSAPGIAVYALGLSLMAATAWTSRFPRFQVGLGALMFVASDLIIFARTYRFDDSFVAGLAVWGLYYLGQLMICVGVSRTLERGRAA
ncbi:MAG: hypothetical protein JWP35_4177 [Caulobacter sp.]|nr:hypothetical protein [Caulobacter sp.]